MTDAGPPPWLARPDWAARTATPIARRPSLFHGVGVVTAAGLVVVVAAAAYASPVWAVGFVVLLLGPMLMLFKARGFRRARAPVCRLRTLPGVVGGWFKADVELDLPTPAGTRVKCWLRAEQPRPGRAPVLVWQAGSEVPVEALRFPADGGIKIPIVVRIPENVPDAASATWTLVVNLGRLWNFEVPVYATAAAPTAEQEREEGPVWISS